MKKLQLLLVGLAGATPAIGQGLDQERLEQMADTATVYHAELEPVYQQVVHHQEAALLTLGLGMGGILVMATVYFFWLVFKQTSIAGLGYDEPIERVKMITILWALVNQMAVFVNGDVSYQPVYFLLGTHIMAMPMEYFFRHRALAQFTLWLSLLLQACLLLLPASLSFAETCVGIIMLLMLLVLGALAGADSLSRVRR